MKDLLFVGNAIGKRLQDYISEPDIFYVIAENFFVAEDIFNAMVKDRFPDNVYKITYAFLQRQSVDIAINKTGYTIEVKKIED